MADEAFLANEKGDIYALDSKYNLSYFGRTSNNLTDIEFDRSGKLFGLTTSALYVYGEPDVTGLLPETSVSVSLPSGANAMAMDSDGDLWIAGAGVIREYAVAKSGNSYTLTQKTQISHNYSSSGDILLRGGFLYLTAKQDSAGDLLLTFNLADRSLSNVQFLDGAPQAYGLFYNEAKQINLAYGKQIGLLVDGELSPLVNLTDQGFNGIVNGAAFGYARDQPWYKIETQISIVAVNYQFFVGSIPTQAGFEYLISSASNSVDLTDRYYESFNQENRFINFANNLGTAGAGAASFKATYASLTFSQTIERVYDELIGVTQARALGINVDAAITFFTNSRGFYEAVASERVVSSTVSLELATKIVAVGSIMNEAMKANIGRYAERVNELIDQVALLGSSPLLGTDIV